MKDLQIELRIAERKDIVQLANFQVEMALETEQMALEPLVVRKGVQKFFDQPDLGFYLIAEIDSSMVACLLVQNEWSDWRNRMIWWIHSVYVHPDFRELGIYRKMYAYLKSEVKNRDDLGGLRLFVDRNNLRAQAVYRSLGMQNDHYLLFEWMPFDKKEKL